MAGLNLKVGGFGGVSSAGNGDYGTPQSYDSITSAAFGPGYSAPMASDGSALHPATATGAALWGGVAAVAALVLIRHSLPA